MQQQTIFREALIADIPQITIVRNSVKENMLSDPGLVTGILATVAILIESPTLRTAFLLGIAIWSF